MNFIDTIFEGQCIVNMDKIPSEVIDSCVTSPPYYRLRDYGIEGQLGLEKTPELFIAKLVEVFRSVKRILKPTATLWINIGDSYSKNNEGDLKQKDLIGIPWMLAFALRADGWYLRQDIIWHKPNPMPESVTDRCTSSHEYLFLLSKSPIYYFDADAIKTKGKNPTDDLRRLTNVDESHKSIPSKQNNGLRSKTKVPSGWDTGAGSHGSYHRKGRSNAKYTEKVFDGMANKRSVWTISTQSYSEAHFATFPEALIVDCIKAGSSEYGCCSQCGSPYKRCMTKELIPTSKASYNSKIDNRDVHADKQDRGSNMSKDGLQPGWINKTTTTGWKPTCKCNASVVPAVIFDPFAGAFTTPVVSKKLGRNYSGCELNPAYIKIGNKRMYDEFGLFC